MTLTLFIAEKSSGRQGHQCKCLYLDLTRGPVTHSARQLDDQRFTGKGSAGATKRLIKEYETLNKMDPKEYVRHDTSTSNRLRLANDHIRALKADQSMTTISTSGASNLPISVQTRIWDETCSDTKSLTARYATSRAEPSCNTATLTGPRRVGDQVPERLPLVPAVHSRRQATLCVPHRPRDSRWQHLHGDVDAQWLVAR